ncbi:LOW QUALITY PROTEIN: phosphatidylinositol 3-kinase C2 domain-containing subunit gamma [Rhynchonycteris naso]
MAYCWKTDLSPSKSHEKQHELQELLPVDQPFFLRQPSLGFDQLVEEIKNNIPLNQSEIAENTGSVPSSPNWDSKKHSLDGTQQIFLNEFNSKSSELSCHQIRKAPVIGFRSSVLSIPQNMNKESFWENLIGKHYSTDFSKINILAPSSTSLYKINLQEFENKKYNYHIGFESSIPSISIFSTDFLPTEENKDRSTNTVEPSLMLFKGSFLPRIGTDSLWPMNIELIGCSIQLIEVPQGNKSLASFCDKSTATAFPSQLFSNSKFNISIFTDNSTPLLHFMPPANYHIKDLIVEILQFCKTDQLFHKDYLLSICGYEEFLENDHSLGSSKIFQKDKSVIQLHLQKNRKTPGMLSKHEDDHSQFFLNQLLEFMHIWKISRQCLSTIIKKYNSHLKCLLKTQKDAKEKSSPAVFSSVPNTFKKNVANIIEEVKNACSVLGCVETKNITDAVNELNLILQIKSENFHQNSETFSKGLIQKVTTELSTSISQLIDVLSSFYAIFPLNVPANVSCVYPGFISYFNFTVSAAHNIPETWVHRGVINFPLETKSLPKESMLTIKLFEVNCVNNNADLLTWTSLPLFPKSKSILGSMLFSLTLQSEPPIEMIAPGAWDISQPSPVTLQIYLLCISFPDQEICQVAVQQLDNLSNDELLDYLSQLIQAIKFEHLESPLVQFLLYCSLKSMGITHCLHWLLKDAENKGYFKAGIRSWYQKLLTALQFCARKALNDDFSKEMNIKILGDIGEKVKSASDPHRQEALKTEIGRLEEFFQCINTCCLPLNPALCIQGVAGNACLYFTSNALLLKITFINANTMGKNISIIFKAGDDLHQDMLFLQIIQLMDNIWLQEGLDMQMIIYRCLSTGKGQGLVQMVPNAVTLAKIHCHSGLIGPLKENTIKKWFSQHNHLKADYEKDRAPLIFTSEIEDFITEGGKNPQHFQDFVELCCRAYNIVRRYSQLLLNLLKMMLHAGLPELSGVQDLKYVYNNLRPQDTDLEATSHFTKKIKESLECFPVKFNNLIHTLAQMTAMSPDKPASQNSSQQSCVLSATRSIQRETHLRFSKKSSTLYLIQLTYSNSKTSLTEKSFEQFSKLHNQRQKQFTSLTLPEFLHWWHLPFTSSDYKRFRDLNHMDQILTGSYEVANSDCVLNFLNSDPMQTLEESSLCSLASVKFLDKVPKLVISYEDAKLTVKHMRNIHLPDGSEPSAHEFYLSYPSEVRRRKTKSVPKYTDPIYNKLVVYDKVTELGHVLMLIVKSKTTFVGAINYSVPLNEEKWYPLGNSIILPML